MKSLLDMYRTLRVLARQASGSEPVIRREATVELEFHGNDYCGWSIRKGVLHSNSVVVDVGLGEDISFSQSLIDKFGLIVHGFDPTPRAIAYTNGLGLRQLVVHEFGIATQSGTTKFFLPNNEQHVSGSLIAESHVGRSEIEVPMLTIGEIFGRVGCSTIDLLKLDVEGAEYEIIGSAEFADYAAKIGMLCLEFHHRWNSIGKQATIDAVRTLNQLGFRCAWRNCSTNEEFLFIHSAADNSRSSDGRGGSQSL